MKRGADGVWRTVGGVPAHPAWQEARATGPSDHAVLVAEVQRRLDTFKYPSFDREIVEKLLEAIAALSKEGA